MQQKAFPFQWPERRGIEDFIVADCNSIAFDLVQSPEKWSSSVVYILGPSAAGKTHLAEIFKQKNKAVKIETADDVAEALQSEPDFIVIDDVDNIFSDKAAQEKLFHLYNNVTARHAKLLMTALAEPAKWVELSDLLSRLQASTKAFLDNPDEKMVKAAYQKLFTDRGVLLDEQTLKFLALRSERSFAQIRALVEKLDQTALAAGRRLTRPYVSQILTDLLGN